MNNFLQTNNGRFYFDKMSEYNYTPEEIFSVLSRIGRYTSHGKQFFSVGAHTLHVLNLAGEICPQKIHLILHDASECYLGDIASPLKALLPQYKAMENTCITSIYNSFKLNLPNEADLSIIKKYDTLALFDEGVYLFGDSSYFGEQGKDSLLIRTIANLSVKQVYETLLEEFYKITRKV